MSEENISFKTKLKDFIKSFFVDVKVSNCIIAFVANIFLAFGMYNIHAVADITEGGILGLVLLVDHWLHISPAITGFICNLFCYIFGFKEFGKSFLVYSGVSMLGFSLSYAVFEQFNPLFPQIAEMPFLASVIGAIFVGVTAGISVRIGGAPTGDDALAMSIAKKTKIDIRWVYLTSDLLVLLMSLSYIPFERIIYSLFTVLLSGQIIGWVVKAKLPSKKNKSTKQ